VLTTLLALQQRERLTDQQMADRLGCSRTYWNLIRNGHRPLTHGMAVRAAGAWPELTRHLLDLAQQSVMSVTDAGVKAA
jgi:transcriptional regulator with XRE-family HTH domain